MLVSNDQCCSKENYVKNEKGKYSSFRQIAFITDDYKKIAGSDPSLGKSLFSFVYIFFYSGFWAVLLYRISHLLIALKIPLIPQIISAISKMLTGVEIHPEAQISKGLFIDHGFGVVIGSTAVIGENVLIYHQVTLGAKRIEAGKRHPTVGNNVIIGAGAKIIGNIVVGDNSVIGAGSVVVKSVKANSTVVGNPGRVVSSL